MDELKQAAEDYHALKPHGKISIKPTKPCQTQAELSLAYTPGVASVSTDIAKLPKLSWDYTNRSNTVAIISDGTAVLGLGNIGAEAAMPVMEGKSVLFKQFADIDALPLCLRLPEQKPGDHDYVEALVAAIKPLEPSLGAINLEDIKAPECFGVLSLLEEALDIPVFHDDQYGTAIVVLAGLINAAHLTGRPIEDRKFVISGAGAAGVAVAKLIREYAKTRIFMVDSHGIISANRTDLNDQKRELLEFSNLSGVDGSLADIVEGADTFIGVSRAGLLTPAMVKSMDKDPVIFALANPLPEIMPDVAVAAGARIVGTGRSDFDNQVNNALGFPGIFRGLLDVRAKQVTSSMMIAAAEALAALVREPVEGEVRDRLVNAYPKDAAEGMFDRDEPLADNYVIPKQFDLRVVPRIARVVAEKATELGLARNKIDDFKAYEQSVLERVIAQWS